MPALLSVENWVPLKPVLGGVRDVALNKYPSCTDSIKPSQQFLCNFVVINASEGSLCFQIFFAIDSPVHQTEPATFSILLFWTLCKGSYFLYLVLHGGEGSKVVKTDFSSNGVDSRYTRWYSLSVDYKMKSTDVLISRMSSSGSCCGFNRIVICMYEIIRLTKYLLA
jgi:hypothetical protein